MQPLVVLRPEPGNAATVAAARALGLEALAAPLSGVAPVAWEPPTRACDCLLLGSANAIRHGGAALARLTGLPVYAVGETTAAVARAAGFAIAATGAGGLQALLDRLPGDGRRRALRLAGEERVALEIPAGVGIETRIVYRTPLLPLADAAADVLRGGAVAALHSATIAAHFAADCDRLALPRETIALACLGPRIAAAAGLGWRDSRSAAQPADDALLALAATMCQLTRPGVPNNTTVR